MFETTRTVQLIETMKDQKGEVLKRIEFTVDGSEVVSTSNLFALFRDFMCAMSYYVDEIGEIGEPLRLNKGEENAEIKGTHSVDINKEIHTVTYTVGEGTRTNCDEPRCHDGSAWCCPNFY
jgi:hypothetical protein